MMTISNIEKELDKKVKAREEMKSEIKDIIIDWEKKLGSLKTKAGGYVNLTYLLGKIK